MSYGKAAVLASGPTVIMAATDRNYADSVLVQNRGPNSIFVGDDSSVTTATGIEVVSGGSIRFKRGSSGVWGRAVSADQVSPADTRWLLEAQGS